MLANAQPVLSAHWDDRRARRVPAGSVVVVQSLQVVNSRRDPEPLCVTLDMNGRERVSTGAQHQRSPAKHRPRVAILPTTTLGRWAVGLAMVFLPLCGLVGGAASWRSCATASVHWRVCSCLAPCRRRCLRACRVDRRPMSRLVRRGAVSNERGRASQGPSVPHGREPSSSSLTAGVAPVAADGGRSVSSGKDGQRSP